ncbi:MAG TPA: hypothetical protein VKT30_13345 [Caulobacteraceae bacterium]|nr:hypothetical protein [Caulobacteraceae bacterium]
MIRYSREEREQRAAVQAMEKRKRREAAEQRGRPLHPIAKGQRQPRRRDHGYLAWLRRAPCLAGLIEGGCEGPVQACHLRMSIPGRPNPGLANKPDDGFAWPGCAHHHLDDQHRASEAAFFRRLGVDPFALCRGLYGAFKAGEEPAAALLGCLAEAGLL